MSSCACTSAPHCVSIHSSSLIRSLLTFCLHSLSLLFSSDWSCSFVIVFFVFLCLHCLHIHLFPKGTVDRKWEMVKRLDAWGIPICSRLVKNGWICNVRWISWWGSVETKEPVECVPVLELVLDVAWVSIIWLTATVLRESQWKGVVSLLVNLLT